MAVCVLEDKGKLVSWAVLFSIFPSCGPQLCLLFKFCLLVLLMLQSLFPSAG